MIKYFCDKCGVETSGTNLCDKCEYEELTCGFEEGDEVITSDGCVGVITGFCYCHRCKERGFYEPEIEMQLGPQIWMTDSDKNNGFKNYYKVGNKVFGNINDKYLLDRMNTIKEEMQEIEKKLNVVKKLKENNNGN
jgi:hypothetical protein